MLKDQSLRSSFSRSSTYVFLGKLLRHSLQYGTQVLLINLLLPADFGLMRYVSILVGMASLINEMGLTTAIVQKQDITEQEISGAFQASIIWGLLLYAVIFFVAPLVAAFFNNTQLVSFLRVGSILIPVASVSAVPRALLQKQMRFGTLSFIEASAAVGSSVVMVFLALRGYGTWSLVCGGLTMETISLFALLPHLKIKRVFDFALGRSRKILYTGAGLVFLRIIDYLRYSLPFFVIGKLFNESSLGIFSVAYDLSLLPFSVMNAVLNNVAISTFSKIQNDKTRTAKGFGELTFYVSVLVIPLSLFMSFLSEEVIYTICFIKNNSSWIGASEHMRWLPVVGLFYAISMFPGPIWMANKKIFESILWGCTMLVSMLAAVFIGAKWGINGVTIALCARAALFFPVYIYVNYRITGISMKLYLQSILPGFICGVSMIIPVVFVQNAFSSSVFSRHILVLFFSGIGGAVMCLGVMSIFWRSSLVSFFSMIRRTQSPAADS